MPEWLRAWREIPMASSVLWKPRRRHAELHACSLSPCDTLHVSQCIKKKKALSMSHADAAILLFSSPSPEWLLSKLTSVLEVPLPLVFSYNIRKQTKAQDNSTMNNGNHILLSQHNVHQGLAHWCLEHWSLKMWSVFGGHISGTVTALATMVNSLLECPPPLHYVPKF